MAKILKKIKEITNKKLADKRLEKQRQKKIEEQNRNAKKTEKN